MEQQFRNKCQILNKRWKEICELLDNLKENIIISDLSGIFNLSFKSGRQQIKGIDLIEEINVTGDTFTLINKEKEKYRSYVVYTEREYHTIGLGFKYNGELVSPHIDFMVEDIITKYNSQELEEIMKLIDEYLSSMMEDIEYLKIHSDVTEYDHYYGEYNKGFDSHYRYKSISEVISDFRK